MELILLVWMLWSSSIQLVVAAQSPRALDTLLQHYAYKAFNRPKTAIAYHGNPPSNLTGIKISAMRLRSGSFRRRGVSAYNEFQIPKGVIEQPFVTRLVLVYHNLGNWSLRYYPLPSRYVYVAPVIGLLAYDASNLFADNLPELELSVSGQPISIQFSIPNLSVAKCVWFGLNGSVSFFDIVSSNICTTYEQGHFSIVADSDKQVPSAPPTTGEEEGNKDTVWIVVGTVVGGLALLAFLVILALWLYKYRNKKKMQQMEDAAEAGEAFETTSVGNMRAPSATVTRTQPSLETEYVP